VTDRPSAADPVLLEELALIDALPEYLTRQEAWTFLRISEATLDRALDRGELARRRIGGRTTIPRAAIRAWALGQAGVEAEHENGGALTRLPVRMEVPKPQTERSAT
jgi:hypothetical protein